MVDISPFPNRKYSVIYADPAWQYDDKNTVGSADHHYSTIPCEDICNIPVRGIAADNSVLLMWATWPLMQEALQVIKSWGFVYKTAAFVWVKKYTTTNNYCKGVGHYSRSNSEPCLLATRGKPPQVIDRGVSQVIITHREAHSRKPAEVRERIDLLFGNVPKIELFARERYPGWDSWGNELPVTVQRKLQAEITEAV